MAVTKAERDRIQAEAKKQASREKESDDQKWLREAIGDGVKEALTELLGLDDDEDSPAKGSGGTVGFLEGLLGGGATRKAG